MSRPAVPAPPAVAAAAPAQVCYAVPKIVGKPEAAFRLAGDYRALADAVASARLRVAHVIGELSHAWRGAGHRAIDTPVETFVHNSAALVAALREAADQLDAYGHRLAAAQRHHGLSLHKALALGAIAAVSVTAIVVTVGAAGVVEAAAASAAVEGATEAAGAASAADAAAAGGIDAALDGLPSLKPLLAFAIPHLVQVEWSAGAMAAYDELTIGRLRWGGIAETGAVAFVASGTAEKATAALGEAGWTPHAVQGAAWAGAAAGDDELVDHRLDPLDVAESFVLASGGTLARDALREHGLWLPEPDYRRQALVNLLGTHGRITDAEIAHELALLRQPLAELRRGEIDLRLHEGPGHTIDRHVSKSAGDLLTRVRTTRIRIASTYWDQAAADDAIRRTLRAHAGEINRWLAAGSPGTLRLRLTVPYDVGYAVDRRGLVRFVKQVTLVMRRDSAGVVLVTSYPVGRR